MMLVFPRRIWIDGAYKQKAAKLAMFIGHWLSVSINILEKPTVTMVTTDFPALKMSYI